MSRPVLIYISKETCPHCKTLVIDHPHGYQQYLLCPKCGHEKKLR